jgi:hypothetical protein
MKNKTLKGDQMLVLIYSVVEKGLKLASTNFQDDKEIVEVEHFIKTKREQKESTYGIQMHWVKGRDTIKDKKTQEITGRVISAFGLQCLKKALKLKDVLIA